MFKALRQALVHAEVAFVIRMARSPRVPDSLHGRSDHRFHQAQARDIGSRETSFPAPDNEYECTLRIGVQKEIHFVCKMGSVVVLSKVLAGTESIRRFIATTAHGRFGPAHRKLVQRIEQIGSRQVAIQVMPGAPWCHCVVQDVRRCIPIKSEQARCIVVDGSIDYSCQRIRRPLVVTGFDNTG